MSSLDKASRAGEHGQGSCGVLIVEALPPQGLGERVRRLITNVQTEQETEAIGRVQARAAALQHSLPGGWRVFSAVHGGRQGIAAALRQAHAAGVRRLVVIPMHPQLSEHFTGRALRQLYNSLRGPLSAMAIEVRVSYSDDASYIDAAAHCLLQEAIRRSATPASHELIFTTSPDMQVAEEEVGFRSQLLRTAELVAARLGWDAERWRIAFGPAPIDPSQALVCELGRLPGGVGESEDACGKALLSLVRRGVHPTDLQHAAAEPLLRSSWRALVERDIDELVMLGVSIPGALALGPKMQGHLRHCTKEEYRALKRPHMEVVHLLASIQERKLLRECFVWSTCNRFEMYGWLPPGPQREQVLQTLRQELLGPAGEPMMNVLEGRAAWRHLLRTASGLNSALGGDGEVLDQLEAAVRTAHHAGSAGQRSDALLADAREAVQQLRQATAWGRYDHRYCWIALDRLRPRLHSALATGRILILGGSSTSCSLLEALGSKFTVPRERIGLIYRGERNGRLAKRLHAAVAKDRALSVAQYSDPAVAQALADADLVFLATDQREPVLHGRELAQVRNLTTRPLTLVDFNTFGSSEGTAGLGGCELIDADEVDRHVQQFNAEIIGDAAFLQAAAEAGAWIAERAGLSEKRSEGSGRRRSARLQPAGAVA